MRSLPVLSVVALLDDMPDQGLRRGQVGTIVHQLAPDAYEVEFVDQAGQTYAVIPLETAQLLQLHHEPAGQQAA